jgi:glycosyltransferase involved in cell wall biosynthesis
MLDKKIAIILSIYHSDSLGYLKLAIKSLLTQTYSNSTIFIYRDGLVPDYINEYIFSQELVNENIILITSDKNSGLANALNKLIDVILLDGSFDYIARMDSDDISRPERLVKQVDFFERNPEIDVCGTSCREFGASFALEEKHLPELHEQLLDYSITHCPFIHPSVMFRVSVFTSGIRYPTNTSLTEDMALWFVLLNRGFCFANLNDILLDYRLNENTLDRRRGISKAISEFSIRFKNMQALKKVSVKNILMITARLIFHLLPVSIIKIAYKKAR